MPRSKPCSKHLWCMDGITEGNVLQRLRLQQYIVINYFAFVLTAIRVLFSFY